MPTQRTRYQITETDELTQALDAAARLWPGESRGALVARIVWEGGAAVLVKREQQDRRRDQLLDRVAGSLTGVYSPDYLYRLRSEWQG
ncbi:MAG: hypothetical protein K2X36_08530 [Microbacteriaceae bacterium]|nr:hypothetical protein [Microbacteriaceae bacterium]